jgi:hypothetical protein
MFHFALFFNFSAKEKLKKSTAMAIVYELPEITYLEI